MDNSKKNIIYIDSDAEHKNNESLEFAYESSSESSE